MEFRYFDLLLSETKGTDQNCLVFENNENRHPKTKVYTPITNLNLTEFKYNVITGKAGAPCVT